MDKIVQFVIIVIQRNVNKIEGSDRKNKVCKINKTYFIETAFLFNLKK